MSEFKEELEEKITDIFKYLDDVLHPIVSPDHWDVYSELHDMISSLSSFLSSAQPESRWIPCSERLPELGREVLVYAVGKVDGFIGDAVTTISERFIFRLFPWSDAVEEWRSPWEYFDSNYEITHWMALPEPPKGEKE